MDVKLKEEKIMDERLAVMPFVSADYGKAPSYAIFRVSERKIRTIPSIKGFENHMTRAIPTPNSDIERRKNNEQIYGAEDVHEDTKLYLDQVKINRNSVIGRELLLSASPQFFKGMIKKDFEHWKDINVEWCKNTFGDNFRAAYLHLCESSPHIHVLIIAKKYNEKFKCYSLQNYRYFNGYKMLRELQDSYHDAMVKDFPVLQRGIKGSRSKHVEMKKLYTIANNVEAETNIETLKAKATRLELSEMQNKYKDRTLKSLQNYNRKRDEEIEALKKELEVYKKNMFTKDQKEELKNENKQGIKRNFSGKRYNKSV